VAEDEFHEPDDERRVTRRRLIQVGVGTGVVGAGIVAAVALSAGGDDDDGDGGASGSSKPRRGGVLEVSVTDTNNADRLNPIVPINTNDILTQSMVFDGLTRIDLEFNVSPGLAESWEPNADGTVWEFRLRDGVEFHDGKTLTADDVVWTLQQDFDPDGEGAGLAIFERYVRPEGVKAKSPTLVEISLERPNFFLPALLGGFYTNIAQEGTKDWSNPPGTGPFSVKSFKPGSLFEGERNPNYWESGIPYLEQVRLVAVPEQATKVQSVTDGTAQLGDSMEYKFLSQVEESDVADVLSAPGGSFPVIVFQGDQAPFDDPRVVEALKLLIDREKIVQQVYFGRAAVTPDVLIPPSDPYFPSELSPPARDVEKAKSLLRQAGQSQLNITLNTSEFFPGVTDIPVLFKEMAEPAGVNIAVKVNQVQTYQTNVLYQVPAFMDAWLRQLTVALPPLLYTPGSAYNESKFTNPRPAQLFTEAVATNDKATQKAKIGEAATIIANEASSIIPCSGDFIWPKKQNLKGIQPNWGTLVTLRTAYLE
jgi:peptide/nickel transport system substrate-binding protein